MTRPEAVGLSSERLARIRPAVSKYVGDDRIAGVVTLVARRGEVVHLECVGQMDRENQKPMQPDTILRLYSMTKPIICVALMTLYEQGYFQLSHPVAMYIPAFQDLRVYAGGEGEDVELVDLVRPVTIRDLLTHTSGLTYPFLEYGPVEEMYRELGPYSEKPLAEFVAGVLKVPLAFQPGTAWRYSVAHDVVACLIEVMSGQPLDVYLQENLFDPLGMVDTGYSVPQHKLDRFAAMYGTDLAELGMTFSRWFEGAATVGSNLIANASNSLESKPHNVFRGGSGLVSTAQDYYRFCQMLLNGGALGEARVLGRKTIELMTANALRPELLPVEMAGMYAPGYGFGLGMRVLMDVAQVAIPGSVGEYGWSGAAETYFWVDPQEDLIGILMAQFQPGGFFPIAPDFRVMAYQAIVD